MNESDSHGTQVKEREGHGREWDGSSRQGKDTQGKARESKLAVFQSINHNKKSICKIWL
jgi:hypothetical protein